MITDLILLDVYEKKFAVVRFKLDGEQKCLVLWRGEEYDAAGDYTQAQINSRISELLAQTV